jgi:hypothetical protein
MQVRARPNSRSTQIAKPHAQDTRPTQHQRRRRRARNPPSPKAISRARYGPHQPLRILVPRALLHCYYVGVEGGVRGREVDACEDARVRGGLHTVGVGAAEGRRGAGGGSGRGGGGSDKARMLALRRRVG